MNKKNTQKLLLAITLAAVIVGVVIAVSKLAPSQENNSADAVYVVKSRDLTISVVESGEVKARHTTDIKCEVEGYNNTIIDLMPEGTIITAEDVAAGKILVELDSSDLQNQFTQQEISYNAAEAAYEEAVSSYDIQIKQNESDVNAARLKEKFALMDFEKYLGEDLTQNVLAENGDNTNENIDLNLDDYLDRVDPNTMSQAAQRLRQLQNQIYLSQEESRRADNKYQGTRKLFEKEYISKMELDADKLSYDQSVINLYEKDADLALFLKYDLTKEAEKLYHDYIEAELDFERKIAQAESKLRMAQVKKNSALSRLNREKELRERLKKSLDACTIRAPAAGMVIYARDEMSIFTNNLIERGAVVRHRQNIITIPSTNEMAVDVKIHESWINQIEPNQMALITLDALPDKTFTGVVLTVDSLPDANLRALVLGSDLKVYRTKVRLDGAHTNIRDGMSAKVEIIIDQLEDVLCVPVQVVANFGDTKVCYVVNDDGSMEARPVEVGGFNNHYIEIKEGLTEGEKISLIPERQEESIEQIEEKKKDMIEKALNDKNGNPSPGPQKEK